MSEKVLLATLFALGVCVVAGVAAFSAFDGADASRTEAYAVPGKPSMSVEIAEKLYTELTPALLLEVYEAFEKTQEDEIYDTLAGVTFGDALEQLYLERVGAMAGGGLEEADQTIHEIKLLDTQVARDGNDLTLSASWQVIGTVGHAEHLHVRGNTYSADLVVSPVAGAWRITDFDLLGVDRDTAGQTFLAAEAE